ncbi:DMT family transporter [Loktanella sp. Alg231-35]|uniref:DMT family transporter n=1 Tax=Loktanella sp. Alg231-35 TaxID=1922220 RepID=UPI000D55FE38|nr:DMT family transporter [Loktanella sp. Alg231-35]
MSALGLGLIAALCWGFHDICIRFLSQKVPISAALFTVLVAGLVFHTTLTIARGDFHALPAGAIWLSLGAGVFFVIASYGLYYAFQRGPVRLVAPLIASFPILSVGVAMVQGQPVGLYQWIAVLGIVCGVGIVATLSDTDDDASPPKGRTILYALIAAVGFAGTFAMGQAAADISHEMSTILVTRVLALTLVFGVTLIMKQTFWPGRAALPWLMAMGVADGIALLCVLSAGNLPNPQYAAVTSSMFGLLTIVLAWVFLRERMSAYQWGGCVIAFGGVGYLAL